MWVGGWVGFYLQPTQSEARREEVYKPGSMSSRSCSGNKIVGSRHILRELYFAKKKKERKTKKKTDKRMVSIFMIMLVPRLPIPCIIMYVTIRGNFCGIYPSFSGTM